MTNIDKPKKVVKNLYHILVTGSIPVRMMDNWFFMKGFGCFVKEFAKMFLESNIKAIRPCTEALTYLLIELRLNGPVSNISVMLGLLQETG